MKSDLKGGQCGQHVGNIALQQTGPTRLELPQPTHSLYYLSPWWQIIAMVARFFCISSLTCASCSIISVFVPAFSSLNYQVCDTQFFLECTLIAAVISTTMWSKLHAVKLSDNPYPPHYSLSFVWPAVSEWNHEISGTLVQSIYK